MQPRRPGTGWAEAAFPSATAVRRSRGRRDVLVLRPLEKIHLATAGQCSHQKSCPTGGKPVPIAELGPGLRREDKKEYRTELSACVCALDHDLPPLRSVFPLK